MTLGVRGKLFAVSVLLMVGVGAISGAFLEHSLRAWLEARAEADLWRQARTARDIIEMAPGPADDAALNALSWRIGDVSGARVTLIAAWGGLLADSQLADATVPRAQSHLGRQEVQAALRHGRGMARRMSDTLRTPMLYAALPFARPEVRGVVRVAMSLAQVEDAVTRFRLMIGAAGLVGLAAALFISGLASHYACRALRALVCHAQRVARGEPGREGAAWPRDEIGGIAGSFNQIAADLTRVVSTLGHERDQIAAILESMSEAVLALDAAQRITLINGAAIALLGAPTRPLGSTVVQSLHHRGLCALIARALAAGAGPGARDEFDVGSRRVRAQAAPLRSPGGVVVVMHDVTEVRRLETVRRDFVANVSHELRTPVAVIRANAETLLGGALADAAAARRFVEAQLRGAERLSRIIADLLDISRVEAGVLRLACQRLSLAVAARRAAETLQPMARRRRLRLEVAVPADLVVQADAQALDQVLVNLLDNAIKYTPAGGHVRIAAAADGRANAVRVRVCDDGPGIAADERGRVFERFYRVDSGRSRELGGTGLGLSIVKHLCEAMGGGVGVEPGVPRGSVFYFLLPAPTPAARAIAS